MSSSLWWALGYSPGAPRVSDVARQLDTIERRAISSSHQLKRLARHNRTGGKRMHVFYYIVAFAAILFLIWVARLAATGRSWPTDRIIEKEEANEDG